MYSRFKYCRKGFGASLVRRVRKAGTDLINMSRKSWHEDSRPPSSTLLLQESESGGNESDGSVDDPTRQGSFQPVKEKKKKTFVYILYDKNMFLSGDWMFDRYERTRKSQKLSQMVYYVRLTTEFTEFKTKKFD